jgi:phosphoribosylglycinamide formyltransferase-1
VSRSLRLATLLSGTGSNFAVLLEAQKAGRLPVEFVHVISNRAEAQGLARARQEQIAVSVIDRHSAGAAGQDAAIEALLASLEPDLILLTGYMRILGPGPVNAFRGRMINQHPSLLPRHKGLHTYRKALEAGDSEHGASIHFVTPELDDGPVIAQVRVPVKAGDDEATLADRLRPREHALLLAVIQYFADQRLDMHDGLARLDGETLTEPLQLDAENNLVAP